MLVRESLDINGLVVQLQNEIGRKRMRSRVSGTRSYTDKRALKCSAPSKVDGKTLPEIDRDGGIMRIQKFLRRKTASQYLEETWGVSRAPSTLAKCAVIGGGPTFRRAGRVPLYSRDDLDDWVASKLSAKMRSTSDTASPKAEDIDDGAGEKSRALKQRGLT